jgi:hypothetical protein
MSISAFDSRLNIEVILQEVDPTVRTALKIIHGITVPTPPRRQTNIWFHDHPSDSHCLFCTCPECNRPLQEGDHDHD